VAPGAGNLTQVRQARVRAVVGAEGRCAVAPPVVAAAVRAYSQV